MRDEKRIDRITNKINTLWHKYPDMRLGQLLENFVIDVSKNWWWEDTDSEANLDKQLKVKSIKSVYRTTPKKKV
jgi:hypothetical protein